MEREQRSQAITESDAPATETAELAPESRSHFRTGAIPAVVGETEAGPTASELAYGDRDPSRWLSYGEGTTERQRSDAAQARGEVQQEFGQAILLQADYAHDLAKAVSELEQLRGTKAGATALAILEMVAAETGTRLPVFVHDSPVASDSGSTASATPLMQILGEMEVAPDDLDADRFGYQTGADGRAIYGAPGKRAPLDMAKVSWNMNEALHSCRPPRVALFHELVHVIHLTDGTWLRGAEDSRDSEQYAGNHEESRTIGLHGYAQEPLNENALRREMGLEERSSHSSSCEAEADQHE